MGARHAAPLEGDALKIALHVGPDGRVLFFECVESTQSLALERRRDGLVILADAQTAGRGCHGRTWHSAPGLGLWFSVVVEGPPAGLAWLGALAVRDGVRTGRPAAALEVRWPNDLFLRGRKVSGVLVEHRDGWSALGIGINVHHRPEDFSPELRDSAGSLEDLTGVPWDRAALLRRVLEALDRRVARLRAEGIEGIRAEWASACGVIGRTVRQEDIEGEAVALDEDGGLIVRAGAGLRRLTRGPIAFADGV